MFHESDSRIRVMKFDVDSYRRVKGNPYLLTDMDLPSCFSRRYVLFVRACAVFFVPMSGYFPYLP